jgi:UDP:flavonoid glycosyltransferase YjiC (YdhE family)
MAHRGRFLFVSWDGGGNVPPALALGQKLVKAGHNVLFLAPGSLHATADAAGLTFRGFREMPEWGSHRGRRFEDEDYLDELWFGPRVGNDLAAELEGEPTDVLVIDYSLSSALAVAERSALPTAALVHTLYHLNVETGARYAVMWEEFRPLINETRHSFDLLPLEWGGHPWDQTALVLALTPREFDRPINTLPANIHFVGPVFSEVAPGSAGIRWPSDNSDPLVLVSLSTTYQRQERLLQRVLDALEDVRVRGLVTTGPSIDSSVLKPPSNVVVTAYVDHQTVLPSAAAVVTHAGLSTVMAALAHGAPLLCLPMGRDQDANAERVVACDAGRTLDPESSSQEIGAALTAVLESPLLRSGAKRMQAIIEREGNGAHAVDLLEGLLPTS